MSYRVELAVSGRAKCAATQCKHEGNKIAKGELRQGTLVTINENTSFKWRHWGCVTPTVLHNWKNACEMDEELIDGYDVLPKPLQQKVYRALEQEHVDDDDWNGDIENNRFSEANKRAGLFKKTPKKKKSKKGVDDNDDDEVDDSPGKKKTASKKRSRAADDDDDLDLDEPKPTKAPKRTKANAKTAATVSDNDDEDVEDEADEPTVPAKKSRKKVAVSSDTIDADDDKPTSKSRGKKKASTKATAVEDDDDRPTAKPKRKGRGKKAAAEDD